MPTQCTGRSPGAERIEGRQVAVDFDGGQISSDAGALLLREVDRTLRLTERVAACFEDGRDPELIEHTVHTLVMQRIVGIALGYEDLNDHDVLRHDPLMQTAVGKVDELASSPTFSRLETRTTRADVMALNRVLVEQFIVAQAKAPDELILDVDASDVPLHGEQELPPAPDPLV